MERSAMFRKRAGTQMMCAVALAALALILAGCAGTPERPSYLRIAVSAKSVVYIQLQRDELRAAMSVEALPDAKPVRISGMSQAPRYEIGQPVPLDIMPAPRFEITLPVPADELPAGLTEIGASFLDGVLALTFCRPDDRGVEWRCRTQWLDYRTGLAAADAPAIALPDVAKLALTVTAMPASGKLGIGLNPMAGRCAMDLMRMDGKAIPAQVRVVDEAGNEIVRKQGTPGDFGFRCDGPCWSVRAAKGAYAIAATLEAGPFGGTLKAETKVAVP
jgi:hypothetical protein